MAAQGQWEDPLSPPAPAPPVLAPPVLEHLFQYSQYCLAVVCLSIICLNRKIRSVRTCDLSQRRGQG